MITGYFITDNRVPQDTVSDTSALWSKVNKPIVPPSVHQPNSESLVSVSHSSNDRVPKDTVSDTSTLWSKVNKQIVPPLVHEQNSEPLVMQCFSHTLVVITGCVPQSRQCDTSGNQIPQDTVTQAHCDRKRTNRSYRHRCTNRTVNP